MTGPNTHAGIWKDSINIEQFFCWKRGEMMCGPLQSLLTAGSAAFIARRSNQIPPITHHHVILSSTVISLPPPPLPLAWNTVARSSRLKSGMLNADGSSFQVQNAKRLWSISFHFQHQFRNEKIITTKRKKERKKERWKEGNDWKLEREEGEEGEAGQGGNVRLIRKSSSVFQYGNVLPVWIDFRISWQHLRRLRHHH